MRTLSLRYWLVGFLSTLSVVSLAACQELLVEPALEAPAALTLSVAPTGTPQPATGEGMGAVFDEADRLRIQLLRNGDVVESVDQEFAPSGSETRIQLQVQVEQEAEVFQLEIAVLFQDQEIFEAERSVELRQGETTSAEVGLEPVPAGVEVEDGPVVLEAIGEEAQLSGAVVFATGDPIPGLGLTWSTQDTDVISLGSDGGVTALSQGEAHVVGAYEDFSRTVTVTVTQVVAAVTVEPASLQLSYLGASSTLEAEALDAEGHSIPADPEDFSWDTSEQGVATVDDTGVVTAVAEGESTVTAVLEGVSGSAQIQVRQVVDSVAVEPAEVELEVDESIQLETALYDANQNPVPSDQRMITWSSSDPEVAPVDEQGLVRGEAPGTATITASSEDASGTSQVTVVSDRIETVEVIPSYVELPVGETAQLTATARDSDGNVVEVETFEWTSSAPVVSSVDADGLITGHELGQATVTATAEGVSGSATVEVVEAGVVVQFADSNLEAAVRDALGQPEGDIVESDLEALTSLTAEGLGLSDLTGLEYATNLTRLELRDNEITDLTPLQGLTELTILWLDRNSTSDVTPLQGLTELTILRLQDQDSPISDITPLQGLTGLEILRLHRNEISDLTPLQGLTGLRELALWDNSISDLTPLQGLTGLTRLSLSLNSITDLTALQGLTGLEILGLRNNEISDVTPLQGLTALTSLTLSHNSISDVTPLQGLTELTRLQLSHNSISDVTPLQGLTEVTQLRLDDNSISDVTPLQGLTQLTQLWLMNNSISDVTPLEGLTQLGELVLTRNQITDVQPLVDNEGLGSGDYVILDDNPLSQEALCVQVPALRGRGVNVTFSGACES